MATKTVRGKPMEMRAFLACQAITQEPVLGGGNRTSLHGIFDAIWIDQLPSIFIPFFLYARLNGPAGKHEILLRGCTVDGKQIGQHQPLKAVFNKAQGGEIIANIGSFPLTDYGTIRFSLIVDGKKVGWPCEITVNKPKKTEAK